MGTLFHWPFTFALVLCQQFSVFSWALNVCEISLQHSQIFSLISCRGRRRISNFSCDMFPHRPFPSLQKLVKQGVGMALCSVFPSLSTKFNYKTECFDHQSLLLITWFVHKTHTLVQTILILNGHLVYVQSRGTWDQYTFWSDYHSKLGFIWDIFT